METPLSKNEKPSPKGEGKFSWLHPVDFTKLVRLFQDDKNKLIALGLAVFAAIIIVLLIVTHTPKLKFEHETNPDGKSKTSFSME